MFWKPGLYSKSRGKPVWPHLVPTPGFSLAPACVV